MLIYLNVEEAGKMEKIIENATIIYHNGLKKIHDAISITDNGVYIGYIKYSNNTEKIFVNNGFIPKDQIKKIVFSNNKVKPSEKNI